MLGMLGMLWYMMACHDIPYITQLDIHGCVALMDIDVVEWGYGAMGWVGIMSYVWNCLELLGTIGNYWELFGRNGWNGWNGWNNWVVDTKYK
jgi:hypothetical protein